MRRLLLIPVLLVALTGCDAGTSVNSANHQCEDHGGVLSIDRRGDTIVCGDRQARDLDDR